MSRGSGAVRIALTLLPVLVMAGIYLNSNGRDFRIGTALPFVIMASVFLLSSVLASFLRRMGHGSGVVVDQMKGTMNYRKPGGQRHSVNISDIREIGLQRSGTGTYDNQGGRAGGALLYLMKDDGSRIPLAFSNRGQELRQFADELSIVTSLSVREHTRETV